MEGFIWNVPSSSPLSPTVQISNTALVSYGTGKELVVKPALTSIESLEKPKRVIEKGQANALMFDYTKIANFLSMDTTSKVS
jgi:hypothetical protein